MNKYLILLITLLSFDTQTIVFYFGYNNSPLWNDAYFILERSREIMGFMAFYLFLPPRNNIIQEVFYLRFKDFVLMNIFIAFGRLIWVLIRIRNEEYIKLKLLTGKIPNTATYTQWVVDEKKSYLYLVVFIGIFACFLIHALFLRGNSRKS